MNAGTAEKLRVALVSHGHPALSSGGGERASYSLFQYLKQRVDVAPVYIARADPLALGHSGEFGAFRGRRDEILWSAPGHDRFRLVSKKPLAMRRQAKELFSQIEADIVHLHHFVGFGTDLFRFLRTELCLPVVVTLHEYLAICNHWGLMLKTNGQLCAASSYSECSACFPEYSSGKFFLRKSLILENLSYVSAFIAPSAFLAERYIDWGIEADRIHMIENPLGERVNDWHATQSLSLSKYSGRATRFGYFGQFTPFKGIDLLLEAVALLSEDVRKQIRLTLFGFSLDGQDEVRARLGAKVEALKDCVINYGPYRNDDVVSLMRSVDWTIVPSVWWENSPVVIQEARASGVPVLCSNIGGMREKVREGIDGAHFIAASPIDLAAKMTAIANGVLVVRPEPPADPDTFVREIVEVYKTSISAQAKSVTVLARPG